jgi:hypothetical protein
MEYGFTDRFKLGIEAETTRTARDGNNFSAYGIEGQYEMTNQSDWWLSSAIKGEYTRGVQDRDADELDVKLIGAYQYGQARVLGNLGLERELGSNRSHSIGISSILQARYKVNEYAAPGIEWHADWGAINRFSSNTHEHYVGPVISGDFIEIAGNDLDYMLGYYWGISDNTADHALRVQLAYKFAF